MLRKIFICTLCVGSVFLLGSKAKAATPKYATGSYYSYWASLDMGATFTGMGALSKIFDDPDYTGETPYIDYHVTLEKAEYDCMNNGGGTGGLGVVFDWGVPMSTDDGITDEEFDGKGKVISEASISTAAIGQAIIDSGFDLEGACINPQWSVITDENGVPIFVITQYDVDLTVHIFNKRTGVMDVYGPWTLDDCILQSDNTYKCTEL